MSDLVAVMDRGRIVQMDAPRAVYSRPANAFVAGFTGAANLVPGQSVATVAPGGIGPLTLADGGEIMCLFPTGAAPGQAAHTSLRPESIAIALASSGLPAGANMLNGEVAGASFLGAGVRYDVRVGTLLRRVMAPADSAFTPGTAVQLRFGSNAAIAVAGGTPGS